MKTANRLLYLDWMRGIAAVIMLQGHVFHSFLRNDLRSGGPYVFSQFVGGMPPAIFLFLTGITLAFLMSSQERKGMGALARWSGSLRRSGYLFTVAFLFRLQLWSFTRFFSGTDSPWTEMLKVDILNCMGFGIAVLSVLAVFPSAKRIWAGLGIGAGIAFASPLITQNGLSGLPPLLRDYLIPNPNTFSFFPWAAFIAFGVSAGSLIRLVREEDAFRRTMEKAAVGGLLLAVGATLASSALARLYVKSDFWVDDPSLVLIKLGALLLFLAFAYSWSGRKAAENWSWVRQIGTTSLLVYWVHIELVYGSWLGWMKMNLDVGQTIVVAAAIIALMVALSIARTSYPTWRAYLGSAWSTPQTQPSRVSGD